MNALLIFLKEPILGKVKPRLAATVGEDEAVKRYRSMVAVLLEQLEGLNNTHVRFCYAPDDAADAIKFWLLPQFRGHTVTQGDSFLFTPLKNATPFTIDFMAQGDGDLGQRLKRATSQAFDDGYQKVAVMGTGCVHCGSRWINTAFSQTTPMRCIIGPSGDGGYYLLATAKKSEGLFHNIPWSSENTLSKTEQAASAIDLTVLRLPQLVNIEDESSWEVVLSSAIGGKLRAALKREA